MSPRRRARTAVAPARGGFPLREKPLGLFPVELPSFRLVIGPLVPGHPQPCHPLENRHDRFRSRPLLVGILDAQDERSPVAAGGRARGGQGTRTGRPSRESLRTWRSARNGRSETTLPGRVRACGRSPGRPFSARRHPVRSGTCRSSRSAGEGGRLPPQRPPRPPPAPGNRPGRGPRGRPRGGGGAPPPPGGWGGEKLAGGAGTPTEKNTPPATPPE